MLLPLGNTAARDAGRAVQNRTDLQVLYQKHEWFSLRDEVLRMKHRGFYRGAVACAFNEFPRNKECLKPVLGPAHPSPDAHRAHSLLAWAWMRAGLFKTAVVHVEAMLATAAHQRSVREAEALRSLLRHYSDQLTSLRRPSALRCTFVEGSMFIPIQINEIPANFMIDSGASISMIAESEARRLKLEVHDVSPDAAKLYGATGGEVGFKAAVAAGMKIGQCELSNVSFVVLRDDQFAFPATYGGALGLPVLVALQTLSWSSGDNLQIAYPPGHPNLLMANICFDGPEAVTQAVFQGQNISLVLDTGNGMSILGPAFAGKFSEVVSRSGRQDSVLLSGVSGSAQIESRCLSDVRLGVGGLEAILRSVHVLLKPTTPNSEWLPGRLGLDVLMQARRFALDFHSMRLVLE